MTKALVVRQEKRRCRGPRGMGLDSVAVPPPCLGQPAGGSRKPSGWPRPL